MSKRLSGAVVVVTVLAAACASNPARSSVAVPLEIPEPPPRMTMDPLPAAEPPAGPVPVPASRPTATLPTPNPPRTAAAAAPPAPAPAVVPTPETPRTAPTADLLPAGLAGQTPSAGQVREMVGRTKQKLDLIDRRRLNTGKQADFDSARRFLAQAEAAMNANNLMLAESSAEKAETLANGLR